MESGKQENRNGDGWGFTKWLTRQRNRPQLHYFIDGKSLCRRKPPVEIFNALRGEASPAACPTCRARYARDGSSEQSEIGNRKSAMGEGAPHGS